MMSVAFDRLARHSERAAPRLVDGAALGSHSVLVGVISGVFARRQVFRCTWKEASIGSRARVVFVVGNGAPDRTWSDVLRISVNEGCGGGVAPSLGTTRTGSVTSSVKLWKFLSYACAQQERWVVRTDDDVYMSPVSLTHLISALREPRFGTHVYAGVFEYYNYIHSAMKSTGFGYSVGQAAGWGRKLHNCSVSPASACQGPFGFAKGPLVILSSPLLQDLRTSRRFASHGRAAASRMRSGARGRVDDDVQLGWWISSLSNVTYVGLKRDVSMDRPAAANENIDAGVTVVVHKLPWGCHRNFSRLSTALHANATVRVACASAPCHGCLLNDDFMTSMRLGCHLRMQRGGVAAASCPMTHTGGRQARAVPSHVCP